MIRQLPAILLAISLTTALSAQTPVSMLPVPPLPPIGLPLPSIGLPPPTVGVPHSTVSRSSAGRVPRHYRGSGRGREPLLLAPFVVLVPYTPVLVEYPAAATTTAPVSRAAERRRAEVGTLLLDLEPRDVFQVYVDGYYVGTTDELGKGIELEPGPHQIEVRGDGYEALSVAVRILAGQRVTYHDALNPVPTTPDAPPVPAPVQPAASEPTTIYVIPGCYIGNVLPEGDLGPGCDPRRVVVLPRP